MSDNLLYFPYINVPKKDWTIKSILYWDRVSAIVPNQFMENPDQLERYMQELVELELVEQIFPDDYLHHIPNFYEAFHELMQNPRIDLHERRQAFNLGHMSRLHVQKFGDLILSELEQMGIARRLDWNWYMVESRTARLFMMYLATLISRVNQSTPATDNRRNIDLSLQQNQTYTWVNNTRGQFLKDLMPYPIDASLNSIRRFKDRNQDQLRRFRNLLEQTIIEVTNISNREQRARMYELKLQEIQEEKDYIYAKLKEVRIGKIVFGSVFGLVASLMGFSSGNALAGTFGLLNSLYSALDGYGNGEVLRSPYAYLALTDRSFSASGR